MRRTTTLEKVLLIGLLVLLMGLGRPHTVSAGATVWTSLGPEGGNIYALAIEPQTPATLYAGTPGGGVNLERLAMWEAAQRVLDEVEILIWWVRSSTTRKATVKVSLAISRPMDASHGITSVFGMAGRRSVGGAGLRTTTSRFIRDRKPKQLIGGWRRPVVYSLKGSWAYCHDDLPASSPPSLSYTHRL